MPRGIRFRPPEIPLSREIRWVLLRAFGPAEVELRGRIDPARAAEVARRLGVSGRVAARGGRDALVDALGPAAEPLLGDRVRAVGSELAHQHTAERLARVSGGTGIPIAFLKSQALRLSGLAVEGSREAYDVDLLVAEGRAVEYQAALIATGFEATNEAHAGTEQHLPGLRDTEGSFAEVHTKLLGVSLGGRRSAGFDEIRSQGLLEPLPDLSGGCFVPARDVSAAYALAHGIAQHGRRPDSYALLWMVGDLIDLGFDGEPGETERLAPLVARSVSAAEVRASLELAGELARGRMAEGWGALSRDGRRLLRHILAGGLDAAYRELALLRVFHGRLSDHPKPLVVLETLVHVTFPSRAALEAEFGPGGPLRRVGHWLQWVGRRTRRLIRALRRRDEGAGERGSPL